MPETLYPSRSRCKTCRKGLTDTNTVAGIYCSYKCGKLKPPTKAIADTPRYCKREVNGVWGFKTKYASPNVAPEKYRKDPSTNIYLCDNCHTYHIGHSRPSTETTEPLIRYVTSYKELGSVIQRYMETNNIQKKDVALTLKVPIKRITEIHEGHSEAKAELVFKVLSLLRIQVNLATPTRKK